MEPDEIYTGKLELSLDYDVIKAKWSIDTDPIPQIGIGLLTNDVLSISFKSNDATKTESTGIVQYKLTTPNILEGKWATFGFRHVGVEKLNKISK